MPLPPILANPPPWPLPPTPPPSQDIDALAEWISILRYYYHRRQTYTNTGGW